MGEGKALLESSEIIFRGAFRVKIALKDVKKVSAKGSTLSLATEEDVLELDLGAQAEKWAAKIANPKTLLEKLGVKKESKVAVVGVKDDAFLADLKKSGATIAGGAGKDLDFLFYGAESPEALDQLAALRARLAPAGAIWIVSPRGVPGLKDTEIMVAGKKAGLVDVKVARFSDTLTAAKFVIPNESRSRPAARKG